MLKGLNSLIESVPLPILIVGSDRHVMSINQPLKNLLGQHVLGRHYIAALRQPRLLREIESVFETGTKGAARFLLPRGDIDTAYDVQISSIDGGVLLAFQDRSATEAAIKSRRAFVANVSHELRTPLTALSGFIETLQGAAKDDPDARMRFLRIMQSEAARMTQLVDDLLSLSRVEHDRQVRPTRKVVLSDLLQATISEMEPLVEKANARIHFACEVAGETVHADSSQIRQVVVNLIENAIKYGGAGDKISITLSRSSYLPKLQAEGVCLAVKDNGDGIEDHHLPRLTERFYRVDAHRSRDVGGTGLGLAIVKHIVQRHGGRLEIESEFGVGTTVSILLPIAP